MVDEVWPEITLKMEGGQSGEDLKILSIKRFTFHFEGNGKTSIGI